MPAVTHHWLEREAVVVEGPDASGYLQGQLTQDVAALVVGASAWSFVLAPQGKVDALVRVARADAERFVLDTDAGWGEALRDRLARFKLRTRAELRSTRISVLAVRGADTGGSGGVPLATLWSGEPAVDLTDLGGRGPAVAGGPAPGREPTGLVGPAPGRELSAGEWEAARIAAGVPVMGAELTERTKPAETGLVPLTVSFTKGCYTGQELVARIDSRGSNVARHLRLLRSADPLVAGTELTRDGKVVGAVTSASSIGPVALGYVGRAVEPGATLDAGGVVAEVVALPGLG